MIIGSRGGVPSRGLHADYASAATGSPAMSAGGAADAAAEVNSVVWTESSSLARTQNDSYSLLAWVLPTRAGT